jgi:hypothetical protein
MDGGPSLWLDVPVHNFNRLSLIINGEILSALSTENFLEKNPNFTGVSSGSFLRGFQGRDFLADHAQSFEQGIVLSAAADGNPEKVGTDMVKRMAVADEDSMGDQFFPKLGGAEVEGGMQLDQEIVGGAEIGDKTGNGAEAMD